MLVKLCDNTYNRKDVESFINSLYSKSLDYGVIVDKKYELLSESFPFVTDEINKRFIQNPHYDFILENLQTHDAGKLKNALLQEYGEKIQNIIYEDAADKTLVYIFFGSESDKNDIKKDEKFNNILEFYNYFITVIKQNVIIAEPRYSESADSYIYENCHGIVYHIAFDNDIEKIKRTGLRCKNGSEKKGGTYRIFPKRIYVIAIDPLTINRTIKDTLKDLASIVSGTATGMTALKINLFKRHIPFYKDLAMDDDISYFTYNNIPPECIEKVIPL